MLIMAATQKIFLFVRKKVSCRSVFGNCVVKIKKTLLIFFY